MTTGSVSSVGSSAATYSSTTVSVSAIFSILIGSFIRSVGSSAATYSFTTVSVSITSSTSTGSVSSIDSVLVTDSNSIVVLAASLSEIAIVASSVSELVSISSVLESSSLENKFPIAVNKFLEGLPSSFS